MTTIEIDDDLARRLREIAADEQRSLGDLMRRMVERYVPQADQMPPAADQALAEMAGMFDDPQATDLSVTVRETMADFYRRKK